MLVWRGMGFLVLVVAFGALILTQLAVDQVAGSGAYTRNANTWAPVGLVIAAPIIWVLGKRFNGREVRVLRDEATGERVELRPDHSFFWLRMEYWGIVFAVIAGLVLVVGIVS